MMRFAGKRALVTGGGRGIGKAIATRLVAEGCDVAIADIDIQAAAVTCKELEEGYGRQVRSYPVDISSVEQIRSMIRSVLHDYEYLDILVNNAGFIQIKPWLQLDEGDWDKIFAINLKGAFFCMQAVAPIMMQRRQGRIINISSGAARGPAPNAIHYGAAKMGILSLTQSAASALGPYNITVNAICPEVVVTNLWDDIGAGYTRYFGKSKEERIEDIVKGIPLGRPQKPEDIAAAVAFLASDDASEITGVTLDVMGGSKMR